MDFDFISNPPLIEQQKKRSTFTIRHIGGPAEIIEWRKQQAAKEAFYNQRLLARDTRITQFEAETGQKLETPGLSKAPWSEKLAFAQSERARLAEKVAAAYEAWQPTPAPKRTLWSRFTGFIKQIWRNANFT